MILILFFKLKLKNLKNIQHLTLVSSNPSCLETPVSARQAIRDTLYIIFMASYQSIFPMNQKQWSVIIPQSEKTTDRHSAIDPSRFYYPRAEHTSVRLPLSLSHRRRIPKRPLFKMLWGKRKGRVTCDLRRVEKNS